MTPISLSALRATGAPSVTATMLDSWLTVGSTQVPVLARFAQRTHEDARRRVVVLLHGLAGNERSYAGLSAALARRGYVVLHPRFRDSIDELRSLVGLAELAPRRWQEHRHTREAVLGVLFDPVYWNDRVRRTTAVLDALAGPSPLDVQLDASHVVAIGHSFGAHTAQALTGVCITGIDPPSFHHPNIVGTVWLSPQGSAPDRGLTARSWDHVSVPLLVVTGTDDLGPHGEALAWRTEPFRATASRYKHLAVLRGADHYLGGVPYADASDEPSDDQEGRRRRAVYDITTNFVDAVHGDRAARDRLASGPFPDFVDHVHHDDRAGA